MSGRRSAAAKVARSSAISNSSLPRVRSGRLRLTGSTCLIRQSVGVPFETSAAESSNIPAKVPVTFSGDQAVHIKAMTRPSNPLSKLQQVQMNQSRIAELSWPVPFLCRILLLGMVVLSCSGCERNARTLTLNESVARDSLHRFLTAWQEGRRSTDLAPKIVGKDFDWETQRTLQSFEVLPDGRSDGANLYMKVRRTIRTPKGTELNQEVSYVVGTSPIVTVFRCDQ